MIIKMTNNKHQSAVEKANKVIAETKRMGAYMLKPRYHFVPPTGWLNDPNGLIQYNGEYHLFYQYNPYATTWATMHWGHAVSKDLINWHDLPVALAPSETYDDYERGGCFSGSTVEYDGSLYIFYTGTALHDNRVVQTQNLAISDDGVTFSKYCNNPIIEYSGSEANSEDFRDPKVWKHENYWYMVVASCKDNVGKVLLYRSENLTDWEFWKVLAEGNGDLGYMWECPDFFEFDGIYVLTFSVMGSQRHKNVYVTGSFDYDTGNFKSNYMGDLDFGGDFYAPQSFCDERGRRIMIGWADRCALKHEFDKDAPTSEAGWCGSMSIPRTVNVSTDGKLSFKPVDELNLLRGNCTQIHNKMIDESEALPIHAGNGINYEIIATFDLKKCTASAFGFMLRCSEKYKTIVECDVIKSDLVIDRNQSDDFSQGIRHCKLESLQKESVTLHIYVDSYSVEVFTDEGRAVMSCDIFPSEVCRELYIYSKNGSVKCDHLTAWSLNTEFN